QRLDGAPVGLRGLAPAASPRVYMSVAHRLRVGLALAHSGLLGLPGLREQLVEDGLLSVDPVLRLIEDYRVLALDHLVGDLLPAMGRQAVHHDRVAGAL